MREAAPSASARPAAIPGAFPAIVRWCREERGLTQIGFAELFGPVAGQNMVSKWERGELQSLPRRDALLTLAELSGYSPGELLDSLGYWGSAGPDPASMPDDPALAELVALARDLPAHQLRAVVAVVRAMRRS